MDAARRRALDLLLSRSADTTPHLNGTLLDHLLATEDLLRHWDSPEELSLAGLCHAAYGTDGFAPFLLPIDDRAALAAAVGPAVEDIVYLYASCDRAAVYPQLATDGPVAFRDRFRHATFEPSDARLTAFVDLTLANELEISVVGCRLPVDGASKSDGSGDRGGRNGAGGIGAGGNGAGGPPTWVCDLTDQLEGRASGGARHGARIVLAAAGRLPRR
jgi:hypothetical protein